MNASGLTCAVKNSLLLNLPVIKTVALVSAPKSIKSGDGPTIKESLKLTHDNVIRHRGVEGKSHSTVNAINLMHNRHRFPKGNKFSPGGKIGNKGGGRKTDKRKEIEAAGEAYARKYLLDKIRIEPVLKTYVELAKGHKIKHFDDKGKLLYTEKVVDGATCRHYVDKMVPPKEKVDIDLTGSVNVYTNVDPDLGPPIKRKK